MKRVFLKRHRAFTLAEALVVLVIFSLIITVIYSAYIVNQRIYKDSENTSEIVQNSRVILERMTREIRQARQIITDLPVDRINSFQEIKFRDGHAPLVFERENAQNGSLNTIILSSSSSAAEDYYKDLYNEWKKGYVYR